MEVAQADIEVQNWNVYDDPNGARSTNGSYAWVMMTDSSEDKWVQIGPYVANGGDRYTFTQCWDGSGNPLNYFDPPQTLGTSPTFKVQAEGQTGKSVW